MQIQTFIKLPLHWACILLSVVIFLSTGCTNQPDVDPPTADTVPVVIVLSDIKRGEAIVFEDDSASVVGNVGIRAWPAHAVLPTDVMTSFVITNSVAKKDLIQGTLLRASLLADEAAVLDSW